MDQPQLISPLKGGQIKTEFPIEIVLEFKILIESEA